jgi:hypothetical protein
MRCVLALGLLITLCASADAATVHRSKPSTVHLRTRQHVIVRHSQDVAAPPGVVQVSRLSAHTSGGE